MSRYNVRMAVEFDIEVVNPSVIDRVLENQDDEGVPQPRSKGGSGWRDMFYDLSSEEQVIDMLAYNYLVNDASVGDLDGWGDLADGPEAVKYHLRYENMDIEVSKLDA